MNIFLLLSELKLLLAELVGFTVVGLLVGDSDELTHHRVDFDLRCWFGSIIPKC